MKVLVTGHDGYLGAIVLPRLRQSGHDVIGLDNFAARPVDRPIVNPTSIELDVRSVNPEHLEGFDAIVHLAGIDGDAAGSVDPEETLGINHLGTRRLANAAKRAGIRRFVFASSYKVYPATDEIVDEDTDSSPRSTFGISKAMAEDELFKLADHTFEPTILRIGSVYGMSPRMRYDLVVNNLTAIAATTGQVVLQSAGTSFCPIVHIGDVAETIAAVVGHFGPIVEPILNVGHSTDCHRVRNLAQLVQEVVPHSMVEFGANAFADPRSHNVSCRLIRHCLPRLRAFQDLYEGILHLYRELREIEYGGVDIECATGTARFTIANPNGRQRSKQPSCDLPDEQYSTTLCDTRRHRSEDERDSVSDLQRN